MKAGRQANDAMAILFLPLKYTIGLYSLNATDSSSCVYDLTPILLIIIKTKCFSLETFRFVW